MYRISSYTDVKIGEHSLPRQQAAQDCSTGRLVAARLHCATVCGSVEQVARSMVIIIRLEGVETGTDEER